jgi:peptidoglycan hydrolase-like protein with peptidoglycan-binding domain
MSRPAYNQNLPTQALPQTTAPGLTSTATAKAKTAGDEEELKGKGGLGGVGTLAKTPAVQTKIGDGHDLTSPRFAGNAVLESTFDNQATVKSGSKGAHVTKIQQALLALSYDLPKFGADSTFGSETEAAVRAFQQDTGAAVDGIVGTQTIGFLDARDQGKDLAPPTLPLATNNPVDPNNIIVQPGAAPIHVPALGTNTYGFTDTETVSIKITAIKNGGNWQAVITGMTGNYSIRTRLLPGQQEVEPGSNTNAANFCAQITELNNLGNPAATAQWYTLSAVLAHERVHATRLRPALLTTAAAIEAQVEAVTIPEASAPTPEAAALLLQAQPAFVAAVANARTLWDAQYVALITNDHNAAGPADTAEHAVVDPIVRRICNMRRANGWPACPPLC